MNYIEEIKSPIRKEIEQFEKLYQTELNSDNKLLKNVYNFIIAVSGKKMRPIITLLCAKMVGTLNQSTLYGAFAIELLHTASLVHDDVIDDTMERRGRPSINAKWTNKVAVLSGDYILSKSLYCASKTQNTDIIGSISEIGMTLADGELLQLANSQPSAITEKDYFSIIDKKTAMLFASCAEVGGLSVNCSKEELEHLKRFGEYLGLCFQMKDDIFDYNLDLNIGKPTGNDIKDGKATLPLIFSLKNSTKEEREKITNWIDNKEFTDDIIQQINQFAYDNGGVDYTNKKIDEYYQKALTELDFFADSEAKEKLKLCLDFVIKREY